MTQQSYVVGETARTQISFTGPDGAPIAVTGAAVTYRLPDGSTQAGLIESAGGQQWSDIVVTMPGRWHVRVTCTLPEAGANEATFNVQWSQVL
jgi:hypothetical protein